MPLPEPSGESEEDFIHRCMSELADDPHGWPQEQRLAICYSQFRKTKVNAYSDIEVLVKQLEDAGAL